MITDINKNKHFSDDLLKNRTAQDLRDELSPDRKSAYSRFPNGSDCTLDAVNKRWQHLEKNNAKNISHASNSVSYTHLTLPTIYSV